ncbi:hypothetical protein DSO57_1039447 [Entomophthora muscae]|uniref:Uncharacterized protein n=1 Tax=Entomophthora muscae TaxID=34485 RepID=A0ACC2S0K2_9FUNG|nr:hypothetical protein DSO57_1039447 [Entomophthora muscae]
MSEEAFMTASFEPQIFCYEDVPPCPPGCCPQEPNTTPFIDPDHPSSAEILSWERTSHTHLLSRLLWLSFPSHIYFLSL